MSIEAEDRRIGQALVNSGVISREQLSAALAQQASSGGSVRLGAILVQRGWARREQVLAVTSGEARTLAAPAPASTVAPAGPVHAPHTLPPEVQAALRDDPHSRCGEYVLLKPPLGQGGFGAVYKAWDLPRSGYVALKVLSRADEAARKRFTHEVKTMRALDHPGIVKIRDDGFSPRGAPYLVMDLLSGRPLDELWKTGLEQRDAAKILEQAAQAVHYAHKQGVVHRDLKPANLIVGEGNRTWVLDLGLAKNEDLSRLTQSGSSMGTVCYMSPEQADGEARRVGPRSDVYSLGATLYYALTGRPPFEGGSAIAVLNAVLNKPLVSPSELTPELDPDLEAICTKCLERDPDERYPSARALARDLDRYLEGEPVDARPVVGFVSLSKEQVQIGAAVAAVGLLLAIGFGLSGRSAHSPPPTKTRELAVKTEKTENTSQAAPSGEKTQSAPVDPKPAKRAKPGGLPRFMLLGERSDDAAHGLFLRSKGRSLTGEQFSGFGGPSFEVDWQRIGASMYGVVAGHGADKRSGTLSFLEVHPHGYRRSRLGRVRSGGGVRGVALTRRQRSLVATVCLMESRALAQFRFYLDKPFEQTPRPIPLGSKNRLPFMPFAIAAVPRLQNVFLISGIEAGESMYCVYRVGLNEVRPLWPAPKRSGLGETGRILALGGLRFVLLGASGTKALSIRLGPDGEPAAKSKHYQPLALPGKGGRSGAFGRFGEQENVLAIACRKSVALFTPRPEAAYVTHLGDIAVPGAQRITDVAFSWGELWALDHRVDSGNETWVWRRRSKRAAWERVRPGVDPPGVGETLFAFPAMPRGPARLSTHTVRADTGKGDLGPGVSLRKGELFSIEARGRWANQRGEEDVGPDGHRVEWRWSLNAPLKGVGNMALIGRVGTQGPWFRVGSRFTGRAARDGKLFLAPNDSENRDNSGSLHVTVSRYGVR